MTRPAEVGGLVVVDAAGHTDIGTRHEVNEDRHWIGETREGGVALVLCDGMGGMGSGDLAAERASRFVADRLIDAPSDNPVEDVKAALQEADRLIQSEFEPKDGRKPGTTCSTVVVAGGVAWICWVGDSRAMVVRDGKILRTNKPHRVVQDLIDSGALTPAQARTSPMRHLLSRSLGAREGEAVEPDFVTPVRLEQGDRIVICSDGLTDFVPADEIATLCRAEVPVQQLAQQLIELALERETDDNVTVIVAGVETKSDQAGLGTPWLPSAIDFDLANDFESEIRGAFQPGAASSTTEESEFSSTRLATTILVLVIGLIVFCVAILGGLVAWLSMT